MIEISLQLGQLIQEQRFPQSVAFNGAFKPSVHQLAQEVASKLLCVQLDANGQVCRCCQACNKVQQERHEDLLVIDLKKGAMTLDSILEIQDHILTGSLTGRAKVVVLHQIENLNRHSANRLLKTIEEPPEGSYFIATSIRKRAVLPTIRSRLLPFAVPTPTWAMLSQDLAAQWLSRQEESPEGSSADPESLPRSSTLSESLSTSQLFHLAQEDQEALDSLKNDLQALAELDNEVAKVIEEGWAEWNKDHLSILRLDSFLELSLNRWHRQQLAAASGVTGELDAQQGIKMKKLRQYLRTLRAQYNRNTVVNGSLAMEGFAAIFSEKLGRL